MFDSDRHNLKKAYSKDAFFSCRVHHAEPYSCASLFVPEINDSFQSTRMPIALFVLFCPLSTSFLS
jgi:hypothetical protein